MRDSVASAAKRSLLLAGYYRRRLARDAFRGVAVLAYHGLVANDAPRGAMPFGDLHVSARLLDAHCQLIRSCCHPISLSDWYAAAAGGPPLPRRPVLMTFDDGYASVLEIAAPILAKWGVPAVVFVCSGPVGRGELFWFDAVERAEGEAAVQAAKTLPYDAWKHYCERHVRKAGPDDAARPMTVDELRRLAAMPGVEIGGHTMDHPILGRASPQDQLVQIAGDKATLEGWIDRPLRAFAYPNGRPGIDYDDDTVRALQSAGYTTAFGTNLDLAERDPCSYRHPRRLMLAGVSSAELAHRFCHRKPD